MAFAVMATQTHHCDLGCSLCDHADIHLVAYGLQLMDCLWDMPNPGCGQGCVAQS